MENSSIKTKVLYVITKSNWGGAQRYVYDLATNLSKEEFEVVVALGGTGKVGADVGELAQKLASQNIRTIFIKNFARNINLFKEFGAFFELLKIIKNEKADVLHLNSSKAGGLGAVAGRLCGVKKIILTVHGWPHSEDRPIWQKKLSAFFSWLTSIFCTDIIVISKNDLKLGEEFPLLKEKLRFVHNGLGTINYLSHNESREKLATILQKPKDFFVNKKVVGTIAELTKNKALRYAISGIKNVPNADYVIIGGGEDKKRLEKQIAENGLEGRVFLTGFIKDASTLLKAFDAFLLPSIKEGLPYVLLEAGQAGVPTVATNVGGIPDIIESGVSGILVHPKNSLAISEAIQTIFNNTENALRYSTSIQEKVIESFGLQKMIEETEVLY